MRIQSNDIVILDTTDSKKIDLHITSNHPTVQVYDQNASQGTLTPDWSTNPLELTPIVYVDSTDITNELTSFVWTKIKGSETTEEQVSTSKILRILTNDLNESATIRYKCTVTYNGKSFFNEITFARVNTGKDGADGSSAPAVKAQYSVNGTSNWSTSLDSSAHKYIRFSYDNGATWTSAIKILGEDGKSVEIKGVAYAKTTPVTGATIVLYSDVATTTQITNATEGDSYLVNGYLCVYNGANFVCTGQIQGPQGQKGDSYYLFIRYADNANGGGISAIPDGKTYIGFYRSSVNQVPTDVSATTWNWSKFVGDNAKSINLTANAQVFKVDKSKAISPTTITVTAQVTNTTIPSTGWTYSIDGGKTFASTLPAGVTRNGNVVTLTGTSVTANSIVIKASDGTYSDVFTIYKAIDGIDGLPGDEGTPAPIAFLSNENMSFAANSNGQVASTTVYCNVVAYNGTTKVTPELGVITGLPTGMSIDTTKITTVSNEKVIPIVVASNATLGSANSISGYINIPVTSPVATTLKLSWSKINSGTIGVGIKSTTVTYGVSDSASTRPADNSWQSAIPAVTDGKYLWTRTVIDYTDDNVSDTITYTYAKQGTKGDTGSDGSSVTVKSIEYQAGTSATSAPTGTWSNNVVSVAEGSYLWTKTTFSDNKIAYGVAKQGAKGSAGTNASLVDITPSAMYFKSTTGKDGTFTPEFIYLYPRFQNATYSNWQYSIDGGVNWASASGANGLTISTYSSIPNTLRISRTSTLYTDSITSISFRCNSATSGVYDTVSIVKIYDVVDLQIGGRNLLLQTDNTEKSTTISNTNGYGVISQFVPSTKTWKAGYVDIAEYGLSIGDTLTFQAYLTPQNNLPVAVRVWGSSNGTSGSPLMNGNFVSEPGVSSCTFTMTYQYLYLAVITQTLPSTSITEKYSNCKLERGHKATDWTPAPEDIDTNIETLTNSVVDIKTTANSAVSRVSETEKSITTINNNISSITNRVSAAEQKITADAIVSTVTKSTTYTSDLGKKVNSTEIISKINQTAEDITISASKIGILGATNIPDLTADKIKGGTLTLGGSNATTQNGQLLVKNASNVDIVKLNKDGILVKNTSGTDMVKLNENGAVVKSGHLAVAEDFANSTYDWDTDTWSTTTNTSQLDLSDNSIKMGVYSSTGYTNYMRLLYDGLHFQGIAQGVGSWGSFVGHDTYGDFVVQDSVRSNISFRGAGNTELANISGNGFYINGPVYGGATSGNARLFTNVFVKNFNSQPTGYICVKLGNTTLAQSSMITIKGHITSYHNSTSFEASCYFYNSTGTFFGCVATMTNPDILREVYFAERGGYAYLILGAPNATWSYPTVAIDSLSVGYAGNTSYEWTYGWDAVTYTNITSNFTKIAACTRGGLNATLWTGAILSNTTITLSENIRNFKFLTCIMGDASSPWGITMGAFMDSDLTELHFGAIYTDVNSIAGANLYGVRFNINSPTSLTMQACGTKSGGGAYMRKIVGWR